MRVLLLLLLIFSVVLAHVLLNFLGRSLEVVDLIDRKSVSGQ